MLLLKLCGSKEAHAGPTVIRNFPITKVCFLFALGLDPLPRILLSDRSFPCVPDTWHLSRDLLLHSGSEQTAAWSLVASVVIYGFWKTFLLEYTSRKALQLLGKPLDRTSLNIMLVTGGWVRTSMCITYYSLVLCYCSIWIIKYMSCTVI